MTADNRRNQSIAFEYHLVLNQSASSSYQTAIDQSSANNDYTIFNYSPDQLLYIVASVIVLIEATIALFVNLYLLTVSQYLRRPIGVNLQLCVSLTASDAMCALFYMLSMLVNTVMPTILQADTFISNCWSVLIEVCKYSTHYSSVFTLLALAFNHYIGIVHPLHRHVITKTTARVSIFLAYLLPFVCFFLFFSLIPDRGFRASNAWTFLSLDGCANTLIFKMVSYRLFVGIPFISFVIIVTYLYSHIFVHMRKANHDPLLSDSIRSSVHRQRSNRRLFVTLILLAGSAIFGWLPTMVQYVLFCDRCLLPLSITMQISIGAITQMINVFKLIIDAFIYASRLIEMRYAIWKFNRNICKILPGYQHNIDETPREFARYLNETKNSNNHNYRSQRLLSNSIMVTSRKAIEIIESENDKNNATASPQTKLAHTQLLSTRI